VLPSFNQFWNWSLPSKYTFIGFWLAILIFIISYYFPLNQKSVVSSTNSYLNYSWESNYPDVFFKNKSNVVKGHKLYLSLKNISDKYLSNIVVQIYILKPKILSNEMIEATYRFNNSDYELAGEKRYASLPYSEEVKIDLMNLIEEYLSNSTLQKYIYPDIGSKIKFSKSIIQKNNGYELFTINKDLLALKEGKIFSGVNHFKPIGSGGMRTKIIIKYDISGGVYYDLLTGGDFYLANIIDDWLIPLPIVVSDIKKARFSMFTEAGKSIKEKKEIFQKVSNISISNYINAYTVLDENDFADKAGNIVFSSFAAVFNKNSTNELIELIKSLNEKKNYTEELKAIHRTINLIDKEKDKSLYIQLLHGKGTAHVRLKEYENALSAYTTALSIKQNWNIYADRGTVFYRLGKNKKACLDWGLACENKVCKNFDWGRSIGICKK
jgi:tetratricopeptide (TPR) repeat protein